MVVQQQHPSVRFQNGEITDFSTAMQVLIEQQEFERQELIRIGREYGGVTTQERLDASKAVTHVKEQVEIAKIIYRAVVEEAFTRAAEQMRDHRDPLLDAIAEAVEHQNYSILAL